VTRRRNPPPRRPIRPAKDKDQVDSDLRAARANRKAESVQKQKLRRLEWDEDAEGFVGEETEEEDRPFGDPGDEEQEEDEDESARG